MTTTPPDSFFTLSSILTGFTEQTLQLAHQTADFYGEFEKVHSSASMASLLSMYTVLAGLGKTPQEIGTAILDENSNSTIATLARALMFFWYTGQIEVPEDPKKPKGPKKMIIPASNFYAQGLAWRAIQAHASGVSNLKFGYWASEPADLSDYL